MQKYLNWYMEEIQTISKKENSSFQNITWEDIQGLSWALDENSFGLNEKISTYACA